MSSRIAGVSLVTRPICQYEDPWFSSIVSKREMLNLYGMYVDQMNLDWKCAFTPIQMISSLFMFIYYVSLEDTKETQKRIKNSV
jgi:hypothetical protein